MQSETCDPPEPEGEDLTVGLGGGPVPGEARLASLTSSATEGTIPGQARLELSGRHTPIPPDKSL